MARTLGYKVIIAETDSNVAKVAETINACDVMMGVHGAGLTNMVFLPNNAILIQILPIGGFEWLARTDFEEPSKDMNLRYLEYKIKTEESTLIQQYPPHHEVIRNPGGVPEKIIEPICNIEGRTEFCEMNGDIRINGKSSTVLQVGMMTENSSWIIGPYARKGDREALSQVTKWRVKTGVKDGDNGVHQCNRYHGVPAVVFSLGGYAGNNFHDYTDIIIPLYLTSRQFNGEVKFLITNKNPWWINKFKTILRNLSHYDPIDIDNEQQVHCLPTVIIGLKRDPKELTIDPSRSPHSMKEFRQFLRTTYSLKKTTAVKLTNNNRRKRPRLLILSRKKTRAFTNTKAIATMARTLGYKVIIAETDSNVAKVAETINACDVMMGVHGAGLTNMVFLPNNAILIQILPIGGFEWLARTDFEEPSKDMNLRYLEYKIKTEESTLIQQYPPHHEVIRNPGAIAKQGWNAFKAVYLQQQNVKLDIHRFRLILSRAIELLHE
ncbi:hypothetical protein GOBAR_AA32060 [Gossypium barbadense]|uniref:Glycosyltransferase 61 catalytic domain-containing protein n=1 Tax=Gossypium barbadense TaxID=3634 RepID=A0A2P5WC23_GOSBA|nr:hypothetical protein GOBAR_AA32060 [Gossypium barbadense]